jgi:hypothetical protein
MQTTSMQMTQTPPLSVVVWANVLKVNRYLSDIVNIALCLPNLTAAAVAAERPDEIALIGREFGAARAGYRLDHTPNKTEWHIEGPLGYIGTILVFGDASISQLRSTLHQTIPGEGAGQALLHLGFLRELADRIECRQRPRHHQAAALQHG